MGLTAAAVNRFRSSVEKVLIELFPALLIIDAVEVQASGPGGRTNSEYIDGGESENFRFPFRIPRNNCPVGWTPIKGASIAWKISEEETIPLEIIHAHVHPWEDAWEITARKRRQ